MHQLVFFLQVMLIWRYWIHVYHLLALCHKCVWPQRVLLPKNAASSLQTVMSSVQYVNTSIFMRWWCEGQKEWLYPPLLSTIGLPLPASLLWYVDCTSVSPPPPNFPSTAQCIGPPPPPPPPPCRQFGWNSECRLGSLPGAFLKQLDIHLH